MTETSTTTMVPKTRLHAAEAQTLRGLQAIKRLTKLLAECRDKGVLDERLVKRINTELEREAGA